MAKSTVNSGTSAARNAVVSAFVNVLESHESSGNIVTQVCNAASKWYKGEEISAEDRKIMVEEIGDKRGWSAGSAKVRGSECNTVLQAYVTLPEAVDLFVKKNNGVQWHQSLFLARRLNKGDSPQQAVKAALTTGGGKAKKATPQGKVASGLKAWYKLARKDKQEAIVKAAALLGIVLGNLE